MTGRRSGNFRQVATSFLILIEKMYSEAGGGNI